MREMVRGRYGRRGFTSQWKVRTVVVKMRAHGRKEAGCYNSSNMLCRVNLIFILILEKSSFENSKSRSSEITTCCPANTRPKLTLHFYMMDINGIVKLTDKATNNTNNKTTL